MCDIYQALENLGIPYQRFDHPPVFTVEESKVHCLNIPGGHSKNLFLRNEKGDRHYLVTVEGDKTVDLKELRKLLNERKLSFGSPERLKAKLGVTPGSVSLLALINNIEKDVIVILDEDLWSHDLIQYHPNRNDATLVIKIEDLERFLESQKHEVQRMKL